MIKFIDILKKEIGESISLISSVTSNDVETYQVVREKFQISAKLLKEQGKALLAAEWASDETLLGRGYAVYACFRHAAQYIIIKISIPVSDPVFPSLTKNYVPAYRFERQIYSFMGLQPEGHPDLRPWIKFEDWPEDMWPLRKVFNQNSNFEKVPGEYLFGKAEGEGVYEIPVGPVHAGIIEPGHFRFQVMGEDIINLEAKLGYVHKGIEKRIESMRWIDAVRLASRVSGDSTVGHALGYCHAFENMTDVKVPDRALWLRALFLERERIANHLGDIGAICNDVGFAFVLYHLMRLKEIILRTNLKIFGHRMMMDKIIPGGTAVNINSAEIETIQSELDSVAKEYEQIINIIDHNSSLSDRLRTTGLLAAEEARDLGVVGLVARASGMHLDVRMRHPFPPYTSLNFNIKNMSSGDVHARTWMRIEEVRESIRLVREILKTFPEGSVSVPVKNPPPDRTGFSAVEGWRGEILYWLQSGADGTINRCMVRDPSALNWIALERCVQGNIVPDFPVCNKSFNQSYSGHDL